MRGSTHILIGLATLAAAQTYTGFIEPHSINGQPAGLALCAGAAIIGALTPDLDAEDATIKRPLGPIGSMMTSDFRLLGLRHRGLTHTGLITALVIAASWFIGKQLGYADVGLAFGLGYLSHVLADALTKHGTPLWWPLPGRCHLLPRALCIRTGSLAETALFLAVLVLLIWLLLKL